MNNNRLGCMTPLAILSAIVTLLIIGIVMFTSRNSFFSSGDLNAQSGATIGGVTSHAEIEDCAACHAAIWESDHLADRCVRCHESINAELNDPTSLHGIIVADNTDNWNCRNCHLEHRGSDAALTEFDPTSFPHEKLAFSLATHKTNWNNAPIVCADCHKNGYPSYDTGTCTLCHDQIDTAFTTEHVLNFGTDCLACHDGKESLGKNFDHATTQFALTGKHAGLPCIQCHVNARNPADLKNVSTQCHDCHREDDHHNGRYGTGCDSCHVTDTWETETFDHNKYSTFKLEGGHTEAQCKDCHKDKVWEGTPTECQACHLEDDEHDGQYGTDCGLCHNPSDWENATFDHNLFAFKLEGGHVNVQCEKCHANGVYKGTPTHCYACHKKDDRHNGKYGTSCTLCHTVATWQGAVFEHNAFPLTNGHSGLACMRCHSETSFSNAPKDCSGCHSDPAYHSGMFGGDCGSCHNTSNWKATYKGPHPSIANEGGRGVKHGGRGCDSCHTKTLHTATCTACHDSNNPGDGGGDGDGDDD